jgi:hypothetical protein
MPAADSSVIAAWVAAVVAGLFGITGFVVGLVGLHHARQAKEAAASANLIAKDANNISKHANTLSEESNGIAREANGIARETADRADEQHDVEWDWDFNKNRQGAVLIRNIGKNVAKDAHIQFFFDDVEETTNQPLDVDGGQVIPFDVRKLSESINEIRINRATHARNGILNGPFFPPMHTFRLRVSWRTERGTPKATDTGWSPAHLPE